MSIKRARYLRRNMTKAEWKLWSLLADRRLGGFKFKRQFPVGPYILDFACFEEKLVIEVDGGQHADSQTDAKRTAWLEANGWTVVRFWNNQVLTEAEGVWAVILAHLQARTEVSL